MIPSTREIQSAIYGAWLLFKLDPRGLDFFEDSLPAFWRSFFAAVIVAPGFAILQVIDPSEGERSASLLAILLVELIAYVIVWVSFPLALHSLCRFIDREAKFVKAVIALNWSVVIQIALILPVHLVAAGGLLPTGLATLAILAALIVTLVYEGFVASRALEISPRLAALVVGLDVAISLVVRAVVSFLLA